MTAVIAARALGKQYGRRWALTDCNLSIPAGHVAGLVGPNGAGKTTLLNLAVGLLRPSSGTIEVLGGVPAAGAGQLARVGFVAQDTPGWLLTGREQPRAARFCRCAENRAERVGHHFVHRRPPWPGAAGRADDRAGRARVFDPGGPHQHRDHLLLAGIALGGTIGVGTLAYTLAIGPAGPAAAAPADRARARHRPVLKQEG
jgi:hypothetical protein